MDAVRLQRLRKNRSKIRKDRLLVRHLTDTDYGIYTMGYNPEKWLWFIMAHFGSFRVLVQPLSQEIEHFIIFRANDKSVTTH